VRLRSESGDAMEKSVYLLGGDHLVNSAISSRLAYHGVSVSEFVDADDLISVDVPERGVILVLDLQILSEGQSLSDLLGLLRGRLGVHPDLVCIAHSKDLGLRLQALRAGVLAYYEAPVSPDELVGWLTERSGHGPADPYRVLVVDDEQDAATTAAQALSAAGMKTRIVADPLTILDVVEDFQPDLLLAELYMPDVTGIELTEMVREHDDFSKIPVVFQSYEQQSGSQVDVLRHCGDDFIVKPAEPRRLVALVQERIQVSRIHRNRRKWRLDIDPVSGLYNRQSFLKRLNRALADDTILDPGNGVFFIGLDTPHEVVKRIGRGCRGNLVALLGRCVQGCLSPADTAGRVGDFSFAVLARRADGRALTDLAERVRSSVADQDEVGGPSSTSVSVGIGLFRPRADDSLTMISRARKGCARAQSEGGNRVVSYVRVVPSTMAPGRSDRLAAMVSASLHSNSLELMYQPIVPMRKIAGQRYEASLRLRAPDGEYIPPFNFLPAARDHGLMPSIDRWVMEHALDRLQEERRKPAKGLRFFVHQTMETAASDEWVFWLRKQIVKRELIKVRPVVQFQLKDVSDHQDLALERFAELRRLGIKVCLIQFEDQPGALEMVEILGVSMVKLSMELVKDTDPERLSGLVSELHGYKTAVIAAGIDNPSSIARLCGCGVDFVQGNFLQFPAEELGFDFSETALM